MKLLLIEDDSKLTAHLIENFQRSGFSPVAVSTVEELRAMIDSPMRFDVIVMDRLLGTNDTKTLLPEIRRKWSSAALVILSAVSTPNERSELLDAGADDYIGKPFSTKELLSRIRALLRRIASPPENYVQVGNLILDSMRRTISVDSEVSTLPAREFTLLRALATDPTKVWPRSELLDYIWGQSADVDTNVVEATIANLRKRLTELKANVTIKNLRNAGYWIAT